ncbi:hypothetical protein PRVXH_000460 [Proteinivorax hydrogeniformans]|uniref:Uncharacterized protein n=1 Tax=Proteinivorax hydrogeniformans TaxID=1826727 RepID=A0AAU8HUT6_9FIRM
MRHRIKGVTYTVLYDEKAKEMGEYALLSLKRLSPKLKNQYYSWDSKYCLDRIKNQFGKPSYIIDGLYSGEVEVWVLLTPTGNVIYVEGWPYVEPAALYVHCKNFDETITSFCKWLTISNNSKHLKVLDGGKTVAYS